METKKMFWKSKSKFDEDEPIPDPVKEKDWLNREEVMGLVIEPLTTHHENMLVTDITIEAWKQLSEANKNLLLVGFRLPEELVRKQFRYFTNKQKTLAYEFQIIPFSFIRRRWYSLSESDKAAILIWQKVPTKFIDTIWKGLNANQKIAWARLQKYLERKQQKELASFLVSDIKEIRELAKKAFDGKETTE